MSKPLALAGALILAAATSPLLAQPVVKGTPPATPRSLPKLTQVTAVGPFRTTYGERVNIHGKGLKRATAVLFGGYAAEILEQTDVLLGFRIPEKMDDQVREATPFVLVPGEQVINTAVTIIVEAHVTPRRTKEPGKTLLDEIADVSAAKPWRLDLQVPVTGSFVLTASTKGRDVELAFARADGAGEPAVRATYGGALSWTLNASAFAQKTDSGVMALTLTVSADAKESQTVKISVVAVVPNLPARTPIRVGSPAPTPKPGR